MAATARGRSIQERAGERLRERLRKDGVVLLKHFFDLEALAGLREAASRCFAAIESGRTVPEHYRFTRQAHSVVLRALLDFGMETEDDLWAPLRADGLGAMFSDLVGER